MPNIFRMGRPTNFKVGHRRSTKTRISDKRSDLKGQGRKMTRLMKRHRNTKIGKTVAHPTGNNAQQFQGQRSRSPGRLMLRPEFQTWYTDGVRRPVSPTSAVTRPITAETETVSYLLNGKTYELQNWYANGASAVNCHSIPAIKLRKAVKLGSCTRSGNTVSATPGGHAAC